MTIIYAFIAMISISMTLDFIFKRFIFLPLAVAAVSGILSYIYNLKNWQVALIFLSVFFVSLIVSRRLSSRKRRKKK